MTDARPLAFWFVHASSGVVRVYLAVSAYTERSARLQARKQLGATYIIDSVEPVKYAHAWVLDLTWRPE